MAFTYGFYNSVLGDRLYDAVQMSRIFEGIITDGVFANIDGYLLVSPNSGMEVKVASGKAWFNRTWNLNDSDFLITLNTADPLLPRMDRIILEVNESTRTNKLDKLTGTPASNPSKPALINNEYQHQYALADIYVGAGVTTINAQDITNVVGTLATPFVTAPLEYISTSELLSQWEDEFDYWFNYIMGELDSEVAGNLQNQLIAVRGEIGGPAINLLTLKTHDHTSGNGNVITPSGIQNRTRSFFVIARSSSGGSGPDGVTLYDGYTNSVYGQFSLPSDFASGLTIKAIINPGGGYGNLRWQLEVEYAAIGEDTNTHSNTTGNLTSPITFGIYNGLSELSLSSAALGDFFTVQFFRFGDSVYDTINTDIYLLGFLVSYTADS